MGQGGYAVVTARRAVEIPILIEALPDGRGFRAKAGEPFHVSAEAPDRSTAIDVVQRRLTELVAAGQVVPVNVGAPEVGAAALVGTIDMTDPRFQKWWEYVEEFRRQCDELVLPGEGSEDGA
jgi:hypothetical protein